MACGYPFIYNKTPSEIYGASLVFINENYTNRPSGSGVEVITEVLQRNAEVVQVGVSQSPPLEFGIEIVFDEPVDIYVLTHVKDWLGGETRFGELQICADNLESFYFTCRIQLNEDLIYNGGYRGVSATVKCNAPWAWEFEREEAYKLDPNNNTIFTFDNISADSELLKPVIEFTMVRSGDFSITNLTTSKTTKFSGLSKEETIIIDNKLGFISSSLGILRVSNFNKVFLKLIKGTNKLMCSPNVDMIKIRYKNAVRMGGGFY